MSWCCDHWGCAGVELAWDMTQTWTRAFQVCCLRAVNIQSPTGWPGVHTCEMSRTVSAWVTSGGDRLGIVGPFPVDVPWWAEVEPVVTHLRRVLGVPVLVLRLLTVEGGDGARDGHVTYHVEALERPEPGLLTGWPERPIDHATLAGPRELRSPWATMAKLREILDWATSTLAAAARPVTGPVGQRKTWNLAGLFLLPTEQGPVWLKTTP